MGGFQHLDATQVGPQTTCSTAIRAVSGVTLSSTIQLETIGRSLVQPFAFERFLKLYHLLELKFDQDVVQRITNLGLDLKGIGKILSSFDSNELARLKQIISTCRRPEKVVLSIRSITADIQWHDSIREIFFQFGKTGNPLGVKDEDAFLDALITEGYTLESLRSLASISPKKTPRIQQKNFQDFTLELAAYWIYRVRSSIAHSRIGEYVMRSDDEEFVASFAETLLRAVLCEVI